MTLVCFSASIDGLLALPTSGQKINLMNADVHTHTKSRKSRTGGLKTLIESSLGVRVHFVLLHMGFHFFDLPLHVDQRASY